MAQLLMQWMKLVHKTEVEGLPTASKGEIMTCEETSMKGQAETMRHVLMQMNRLRHF